VKTSAAASRQQAKKQHFIERIDNHALLPGDFKASKMPKKNNTIAQNYAIHRSPHPLLRIRGLKQIQHSLLMPRAFSPDCPGIPC
jgi:hypothetical protein